MAINVLFQPTPTTIDSLTLDAVLSGSCDSEVEVTEHPIETGANIGDHRRLKPETVSIEGLISATPIPGPADAKVERNRDGVKWFSASDADPGAPFYALGTLRALLNADDLITLVTPRGTYENMTLVKLSVPLDPKKGMAGTALFFTATFKQLRVVTNATVTIKQKVRPPIRLVGKKVTTPKEVAQRRKSILLQSGEAVISVVKSVIP